MNQTISNLINVQASLAAFAAQSENPIAKRKFQLSAQLTQEVIDTLQPNIEAQTTEEEK